MIIRILVLILMLILIPIPVLVPVLISVPIPILILGLLPALAKNIIIGAPKIVTNTTRTEKENSPAV